MTAMSHYCLNINRLSHSIKEYFKKKMYKIYPMINIISKLRQLQYKCEKCDSVDLNKYDKNDKGHLEALPASYIMFSLRKYQILHILNVKDWTTFCRLNSKLY